MKRINGPPGPIKVLLKKRHASTSFRRCDDVARNRPTESVNGRLEPHLETIPRLLVGVKTEKLDGLVLVHQQRRNDGGDLSARRDGVCSNGDVWRPCDIANPVAMRTNHLRRPAVVVVPSKLSQTRACPHFQTRTCWSHPDEASCCVLSLPGAQLTAVTPCAWALSIFVTFHSLRSEPAHL